MKLTFILLTVALLQVQARGLSQSITLSGRNMDMREVFSAIRKQTGYVVFFRKGLLEGAHPVSVAVHDMPLKEFLELTMKDQPFTYLILDKTISLSRKETPAIVQPPVVQAGAIGDKVKDGTLKGRVLDADGRPLAGATIAVRRSKVSTTSDAGGNFALSLKEGDVLTVSFVGYASQEVRITAHHIQQAEIPTFRLQPDASNMDQVQIIGYGTTTKRFNPGDVTTITAKEIEKNPVNNVLEAIQGKVPGLFIQQVTGQPGGAFTMRLRGSTNLSNNGNAIPPLIIVDGVRYPTGALPMYNNLYSTSDFLQGGNGLNYINPHDIASIDVLKDADATAIYGSAGAYGVIIITTKKAKPTAPSLSANIYTGVSVKGEAPRLLNTQQYIMLRKEAVKNDGATIGPTDIDINGTWPADRYHDWRKVYTGASAQSTNASVSYSGGARNTSYVIGGSLQNNGNIQRHKGSFRTGTLRFSLNTATVDNKFSLGLSGSWASSKSDMVPFDFSQSLALDAPNAPPAFLPNGSVDWVGAGSDPQGPSSAANINRTYNNLTSNLLANATLEYKPVKGVTLRSVLGYNEIMSKELVGYPTTTKAPTDQGAAQGSVSAFHHYDIRTVTVSPYAAYDRTLWKGDLSIKAGGEITDRLTYQDEIIGTGFASDALMSNPMAANSTTSAYSQTPFRSMGFYGIIKYVWDQKYILDLNGRRDGSTKFGRNHRFGNFGSIGAAWIFSEEKFIKDNVPFLSFGKLRASTGVVGGDAIKDFMYLSTYTAINGTYDNRLGLEPGGLANPNLEWEKNRNKEVGLELSFLKERIFVEGNYYRNVTSNQLVGRPISSVTGFSGFTLNSDAVIRNSGWEISLSTTNIRTKDFSWTTRWNISIPTSKLIKAPSVDKENLNYIVGKPLTGVRLYKYAGIDTATGVYSFTNAKGVTGDYYYEMTDADKTEFVDLAPRYFGGFSNSFTYKQWSLDVFFNFTSRKGLNSLAQAGYLFGYWGINGTTDWLRRWQKPGDKTDMPKVSTNLFDGIFRQMYFTSSTGAYTNATYARLQNVSLRYHFDQRLVRRLHLGDLTVYLQGQNLLTISKFGGLDPENLNAAVIPPLRTFTAGINLSL
jgi:TonB-linked SusC/RagA family outer membrane protein